MIRGRLLKLWREARQTLDAGRGVGVDRRGPGQGAQRYKSVRGLGGFVRADWDEVNEMIAAANAYTIRQVRPRPRHWLLAHPAMSMVSYAAGCPLPEPDRRRLPEVLRLVLRPAARHPADLGRADRRARNSADWYNSSYLMMWGSNVPQTRTPDAHFYTEVRYKGTKSVAVSPDFGEMVKFGDIWLRAEARHRRRAGDGDGPRRAARNSTPRTRRASPHISATTSSNTPTCPCSCCCATTTACSFPITSCAPRISPITSTKPTTPQWKTLVFDARQRRDCRAERLHRVSLERSRAQRRSESRPLESRTEGWRQRSSDRPARLPDR